jgi:hypothetical protein
MKDYKLKSGNILRVLPDPNPESPDTWENEDVFLVYDHRQFTVKREGFEPRNIFNALTLEYPNEPIRENFEDDEGYQCAMDEYHADFDDCNDIKSKYVHYFIFPVDAYIHSGVHLSLANTEKYPDRRWDVSTTGYILVKKEMINLEGENNFQVGESEAKEYAENLIQTWNQYLSGEIYGYQILKTENKEIDSCWGFFGDDPNENGILYHINDEILNKED